MASLGRLRDKVAIVTASTAGIGLGIATRLASEGAKVVISSRKQESVDRIVQDLTSKNFECIGVACHVGSQQDIRRLVDFTVSQYGKIDIVVSNAAVNPSAGSILECDDAVIDKIFDINGTVYASILHDDRRVWNTKATGSEHILRYIHVVKSAIHLVRMVEPHMNANGSVIFITSYTAFNPSPPIGMYAVSKTALLGLTKALAEELGPERQIRVNAIAPGVVPTKFASALVATESMRRHTLDKTLLRRLGTPENIAAVAAMLASDDGSYITGETIVVAGGMQSRL